MEGGSLRPSRPPGAKVQGCHEAEGVAFDAATADAGTMVTATGVTSAAEAAVPPLPPPPGRKRCPGEPRLHGAVCMRCTLPAGPRRGGGGGCCRAGRALNAGDTAGRDGKALAERPETGGPLAMLRLECGAARAAPPPLPRAEINPRPALADLPIVSTDVRGGGPARATRGGGGNCSPSASAATGNADAEATRRGEAAELETPVRLRPGEVGPPAVRLPDEAVA